MMASKGAILIVFAWMMEIVGVTGGVINSIYTTFGRDVLRKTAWATAAMLAAMLPAKAQTAIGRAPLPPVEYDHPYSGKLLVVTISKRDLLQFLCSNDKVLDPRKPRVCDAKGCSTMLACAPNNGTSCMIVLGPGTWTDERVLRHEIGHCNGWPADHRGARK
jgi:hypothetical protein